MPPTTPTANEEQIALNTGFNNIAGVDEAGRGAWAGPVVAAAVQLNLNSIPTGLNDSKKLTPQQRQKIFAKIIAHAQIGIGIINSIIIDETSILIANYQAMAQALNNLNTSLTQKNPNSTIDFLLIDGRNCSLPKPWNQINQKTIIGGDGKSVSIAAASIIAKVTRDRLMTNYNNTYPGYGFAAHKGYGTKQHLNALIKLGITPIHRLTYRPITNLLHQQQPTDPQ